MAKEPINGWESNMQTSVGSLPPVSAASWCKAGIKCVFADLPFATEEAEDASFAKCTALKDDSRTSTAVLN